MLVEGGMRWIDVAAIAPAYAVIVGGVLIGIGLLILLRHDASLGGIGILAPHLQKRQGIRSGYVQSVADALILVIAALALPTQHFVHSIVSILVFNAVLAVWAGMLASPAA